MAIGERIGFFRKKRGMTQKYLGQKIGFPERSADVRMAQYEVGSRKPKEDVTNALAEALDVSPRALNVPDMIHCWALHIRFLHLRTFMGWRLPKKMDRTALNRTFSKVQGRARFRPL